jgi:gliding motility-associated-like protein
MSNFKIIFVIVFGVFGLSGTPIYNSSETTIEEIMDPIEYIICDDDGFVELDIQTIQNEILANYDNDVIEETVYVSTSDGAILKFNNLSGTITIELICDFPYGLTDIAVDEQEVIHANNFTSIFSVNTTDCTIAGIPNLGPSPSPFTNSLSFDTQGNVYFGGGSESIIYRFNSDGSSPPYVWHDFGFGSPGGDFVMLNGKMYVAWGISNGTSRLFEVTVDANFNYVSHVNLGVIPNDTWGLASELGNLYAVALGQLYKINLDTFTFDTIIVNDFTYGLWFGAAGLHEAFDYEITSHLNLTDANGNINPLPNLWTNTQQGGQTIYIRVENTLTGTFEIIEVTLVISDNQPNLIMPSDLTICENENNGIFDLTDVETELLQNVSHAVTMSYHTSEEDASDNINAVDTNYQATSNQETIYVRVQNVDIECFATTQFDIILNQNPEIVIPSNLIQCEYESNGVFVLTDVETELLQNTTNSVTVTYHITMDDATMDINSIVTNYQISPGQETIFVRVQSNDNNCFATTQFEIILNGSLQINIPSNISQCANQNNGPIDLTQVESEILANTTQNVVATYHASLNDANTNANPISTNYTLTSNQDTIYIRLQDIDTDCFTTTQFDIITIDSLNITAPSDFIFCEGENNGLFDLTQVENEILQNVTQAVNISYHASADDANNDVNDIDTNFMLTSGQATIHIRIENTGTDCFDTTQFTIQVLDNPLVEPMVNSPSARLLTDCYIDGNTDGYFDLNTIYDQIITNGNTSYSLEFYLSEDDAQQEINTIDAIYYAVNNTEEIFVTVTNDNDCKSITNFFVDPDCYNSIIDIGNIYFPQFFTPNNDMINDTWNVRGVSVAVQQTAIIYIFDRYGKLLYYFKPGQTQGWNGTYRGKQLPSTDYWYKMETLEGQTFSGSFSLIRK